MRACWPLAGSSATKLVVREERAPNVWHSRGYKIRGLMHLVARWEAYRAQLGAYRTRAMGDKEKMVEE